MPIPDASRIVPGPFSEIPPSTERFTTLQFHEVMRTLLEQCQGLAAVCHTSSQYPDLVHPRLTEALDILSNYLDAARKIFQRWVDECHPGATITEEDRTDG